MNAPRGIVYSTEHGGMCPACGKPVPRCECARSGTPKATKGAVRVGLQTKNRKGKGVTVVTGLPLTSEQLTQLGKELKKQCGSGGTVKNGTIEIQGDHRDLVVGELQKRGWKAKRSGG